jgi:glycosyltransferase involved in cell wall biosynthesis
MAKIAMFLARSPGPPMTGRKALINTAIAALAEGGHDIDLFILARPDAALRHGGRVTWLGTTPKVRMLCNAALSVLGGRHSLNEALFRSGSLLALARGLGPAYDFAIADTIRAAPYANELGVPWHLDLDDLFSARYEKYLERPDQLSADLVLGYYRDSVPRVASVVPKAVLKRLLMSEAARLRHREMYWAGKATTVSLVSPDEAESFARVASRQVHSLPMSIDVPARRWMPGKAIGARAVFLGGLDYKPNLDALLYYQEEIFPLLNAVPGVTPTLHHVGNSPPELRKKFLPEVVCFEGYVSDLAPRLNEAAVFLAPIVSGTGIKTKVLEAMAIGLPVVGTRHAVAGLKVEHKKHCFICERPAEFAEGIRYLGDPEVAEKMGLEARNYVQANFSMNVLRQRWANVVHDLATGAGKCSML